MSVIAAPAIFVDSEGFTSAAELRAAHGTLLRQESNGSDDTALLSNIRGFLQRGSATGLILDNERERRASQSILDYWATVFYRGTSEIIDSTLDDFDIERAPEIADDLCPYLGLESFGEQQHAMFFGRKRVIQQYLKHLEEHRLLAVVGQSGSGKSSLVLAGLLPQLHQGALQGSSTWAYVPRIVPGKEPLISLAEGILEFLLIHFPHARKRLNAQRATWVTQFVAGALHDDRYLVRQVNALVKTPLVLVVDQFEELFTVCENNAMRQALIANMLTLIESSGLRHIVILTMRSEYESYVARFQRLNDAFDKARLSVAPMVPSELRETIEEPARSVGLKIDPGVVDALVGDVVGEPAALPLLQFTLLKLWESRERNRVTREAYQQLGGGRIALERSADAFYGGLSLEQQTTVHRLLLRMVRPAYGLEFTNNRVQIGELQQIGEPIERIDEVLKKLVEARLIRLTSGETWSESQVEVAHEALVRNWQKLSDWLEQARKQLRERRNLTLAAEQWQSLGRETTALLRGRMLTNALDLDIQGLTKVERDFLRESELAHLFEQVQEVDRVHALSEAKRQQVEADRQRDLAEAERQRAEERGRTAKWLRRLATGLAIALSVALVAIIFALYSFFDANTQRIAAEEQRLLAQHAQGTADASRYASERIVVAESNARATSDAAGSTAIASENTAVSALQSAKTDSVKRQTAEAKELAAQATTIALVALRATDAANNAERAALLAQENATQVAELQQTQQAQAAQQVVVQSLQNREQSQEMVTQSIQATEPLRALQLAEAAAVFSQEQSVEDALQRAIQLYTDESRGTVGPNGAITQISWNPDSLHFVTSSSDESTQTWEFGDTGGIHSSTFTAHKGTISSSWSPDGQRVALADSDGAIGVWNPNTGEQLITIQGHLSSALSIAWSPDSRRILSTGSDNTIRLWDASSGAALAVFTTSGARVTWAAWSPDGQQFVSFAEKSISVWRWADKLQEFTIAQPSIVRSAAWAPDGKTVLTAAVDGTVRIWDATNGTAVSAPITSGAALNSAMWSPSGMSIVTAGDDGSLRVWNAASGKELSRIQINAKPLTFASWSPDSRRIIAGSKSGELRAYYVYFDDILGQARALLAGRALRP